MTRLTPKYSLLVGTAVAMWMCNGPIALTHGSLVAQAEADPGVTRRAGAGARGVGATPAPGVKTPSNRGGPVNRAGGH